MEEIAIVKFEKEDYHIPEPSPPAKDWRTLGLATPAILGVVGLMAFAILAYSFKELQLFNEYIRANIVIWGAVALAIGGEVGTLFTNIEIFRKVAKGTVNKWDWTAFATSVSATILAFLLAAAKLLEADVFWSDLIKQWGQILLIVVSALDQYAGQMELGLYMGSYDQRMHEWEVGFHAWLRQMAEVYGPGAKPSTQTVSPAPAPKSQRTPRSIPGGVGQFIKNEGDSWRAHCPYDCGWVSTKTYIDPTKAQAAIGGHMGKCPKKDEPRQLKEDDF